MLEIKNLSAAVQGKTIISDINAVFENGKVSVLMGPNGSGKSTLIRSILKMTEIKSGSVYVGEKDISGMDSKELAKHIAYMPQSRNVPDITVKRLVLHGRFPYLSYPRNYRKSDWEVVDSVLELLDLKSLADRKLTELSGGQRQRVYLAMALAQETEVVLMDEPATFLDIKSQLDVLDIADQLADMNKTVILVLHDFESILRCADRVFLMSGGRLVTCGKPENILISEDVEKAFNVEVRIIDTDEGKHCFVNRAI